MIPIEDVDRGRGRRTYVHVAGLDAPIVASRSEAAILADMQRCAGLATAHRPPVQRAIGSDATAHGPRRSGLRWRRRGGVGTVSA
jgi:hypothetical protein